MIKIYFDGGCQPNPGKGYGSYQCVGPDFNYVASRVPFGERLTSNMAEYLSLIQALKWLSHRDTNGDEVHIFTDSMLVCNQVQGRWKTKLWFLKDLKKDVLDLLEKYPGWRMWWVPRQENVKRFGH